MAMVTLNSLAVRWKCGALIVAILSSSALLSCSSGGSAPVDNAWNNIATTQVRHKVQPGETIYSIAWRYNLNYKDLAAWNQLQKPYYLNIGQMLRLTAPAEHAVSPAESVSPDAATNSNKIAPPLTFTPVSSTAAPAAASSSSSATSSTPSKAVTTDAATPAVTAESPGNAGNNSGWPRPVRGKIIESYGENGNKGIDIATPVGTKVRAAQSGSVVYAGSNLRGYGQLVIVKQKGDLMTAYAHNSKLLVAEGDVVKAGQPIALSGDTEAKQPMLHLEVRKAGKPVDPMPYFT